MPQVVVEIHSHTVSVQKLNVASVTGVCLSTLQPTHLHSSTLQLTNCQKDGIGILLQNGPGTLKRRGWPMVVTVGMPMWM